MIHQSQVWTSLSIDTKQSWDRDCRSIIRDHILKQCIEVVDRTIGVAGFLNFLQFSVSAIYGRTHRRIGHSACGGQLSTPRFQRNVRAQVRRLCTSRMNPPFSRLVSCPWVWHRRRGGEIAFLSPDSSSCHPFCWVMAHVGCSAGEYQALVYIDPPKNSTTKA